MVVPWSILTAICLILNMHSFEEEGLYNVLLINVLLRKPYGSADYLENHLSQSLHISHVDCS